MSRAKAISAAHAVFDSGVFRASLARRVAIPTESQNPDRAEALHIYLEQELVPDLASMGFSSRIDTHAEARGPFLIAERIEDASRPTVLESKVLAMPYAVGMPET